MKLRLMIVALLVILSMSGCSDMFSGSYYSAEPHPQDPVVVYQKSYVAVDIGDLREIFKAAVEDGHTQVLIQADEYDQDRLEDDLREAYLDVLESDPLVSYAVEGIATKVGNANGKTVVTLTIEYTHEEGDLKDIKKVATMDDAIQHIHAALENFDLELTLCVDEYEERDVVQVVEDYALYNPHLVMEVPQVSVSVSPYAGESQVVEIDFTYSTNRSAMKRMKEEVTRIFDSADLYVGDNVQDPQKYFQLLSFLMERFEYRYQTSITPAYSLLYYGVGDSRAFAQVYAAMCRQEGLECQVVSGTRDGQSHCWVIIRWGEQYRHLDLRERRPLLRTDDQMEGYVWDYSAHPACVQRSEETTGAE